MSQNKTICQKIAGWFEPQTAPQQRFYVPEPAPKPVFDWHPILEVAKLEISSKAEVDLTVYKEEHEKAIDDFFIEISSYRNNTIKIVRKGQIDIIPIEDIRKVSLILGHAPETEIAQFEVYRSGEFERHYSSMSHGFSSYSETRYKLVSAPRAIASVDDKVDISPTVRIICPFGLGDSILNKIQELMAE